MAVPLDLVLTEFHGCDLIRGTSVNGPEICHEIDADGNIDIRGRRRLRPGADDAAVHGRHQAEEVVTVPIRPALQTPPIPPTRWRRPSAWRSSRISPGSASTTAPYRRSQRAHGGGHQGISEGSGGGKPTGVLNPQERSVLAETAKRRQDNVGWKIVTDAGTGARLGIPDQAGAAANQRRQRREMEFTHRHHPDSALAAQGSQPDHGEARRAGKERTRRPHGRLYRGQAGLLRAVRACRA